MASLANGMYAGLKGYVLILHEEVAMQKRAGDRFRKLGYSTWVYSFVPDALPVFDYAHLKAILSGYKLEKSRTSGLAFLRQALDRISVHGNPAPHCFLVSPYAEADLWVPPGIVATLLKTSFETADIERELRTS